MPGFLNDLALDSVESDPNTFPDGTYEASVYDAKVIAHKDAAKGQSLVLTYKILDGDHKGKTIDEWKSCNAFDDGSKKAWLKNRILSLGVPENKLNDINPTDLVGTPVIITKKRKGEYDNVTYVRLNDGSTPANSTDVSDLL